LRRLHLAFAFVLCLLAAAVAPGTARATAVPPPADVITTYIFTGDCLDCAPIANCLCALPQGLPPAVTATATLVLKNYTEGTIFGIGEFVSFVYDSPIYHYDSTAPNESPVTSLFAGQIPGFLNGGPGDLLLEFENSDTGVTTYFFALTNPSLPEGSGWCIGDSSSPAPCPGLGSDYGFTYNITQAPEPGTLALLGAGLVGLGVARRRKAA